MNKFFKISFFGENDLTGYTYCIDPLIKNINIREELSKKIHNLNGVNKKLKNFNFLRKIYLIKN